MPQRLTKSSIYSRSLGLSACASLESKNEVCLLCEVSPKANPSLQIHLCFFGEQSQPLKILGKGEKMAAQIQNVNALTPRSLTEKKKLNGTNFLDWHRNLRIILEFRGDLSHHEYQQIRKGKQITSFKTTSITLFQWYKGLKTKQKSGVSRWSDTVDRRWPPLTNTIDRRWPSLTGGIGSGPVTVPEQFGYEVTGLGMRWQIIGGSGLGQTSKTSLTYFETSDSLLKEFADELTLLDPFPPGNENDNFDPEVDLREIEYLLNQDPSTDSSPTTDIDIIDPILERFTDESTLVYSSPPGDDDDDLFDFKSDNKEWKKLLYGDHFNDIHSGKDKIKDSKIKILIDELESPESNVLLPLLPTHDSTLPKESSESSKIATLLSSPFRNEDKVFNPGILILGGTQTFNNESKDKNLKVNISSEAFLFFEERNFLSISFDQELLFHLELSLTETLLLFSSENEDKVFNPGILISKGVHSFTLGLSHRTYETFKIVNFHPNILNESPMKIFSFFCFCPKKKGIRG
ncbi:hypothetical protein Tco_0012226 [Tanacetum coccineum]